MNKLKYTIYGLQDEEYLPLEYISLWYCQSSTISSSWIVFQHVLDLMDVFPFGCATILEAILNLAKFIHFFMSWTFDTIFKPFLCILMIMLNNTYLEGPNYQIVQLKISFLSRSKMWQKWNLYMEAIFSRNLLWVFSHSHRWKWVCFRLREDKIGSMQETGSRS